MRWNRLPALLVLLVGASCLAQIPDRKELTGNPKFVEESPKPNFRTFTEAQLRAEIKIVSRRSYAVFGYNTPEVRVDLPQVSNSAYSKIEFGPAALLSAAGQKVPFELEESGYMDKECASEIRFHLKDYDKVIQFARARGQVKVKYPLAVKTDVTTPSKPELAVTIDGPYVNYVENEDKTPQSSFSKLKPLRAYDKDGRQLERHGYWETTTDDNGVDITHAAFYGNVARVEIDTVESWAELDLPYDLTPAPLFPAGHEGEEQETPQK